MNLILKIQQMSFVRNIVPSAHVFSLTHKLLQRTHKHAAEQSVHSEPRKKEHRTTYILRFFPNSLILSLPYRMYITTVCVRVQSTSRCKQNVFVYMHWASSMYAVCMYGLAAFACIGGRAQKFLLRRFVFLGERRGSLTQHSRFQYS